MISIEYQPRGGIRYEGRRDSNQNAAGMADVVLSIGVGSCHVFVVVVAGHQAPIDFDDCGICDRDDCVDHFDVRVLHASAQYSRGTCIVRRLQRHGEEERLLVGQSVPVEEARLSHLAYASEIAEAMLKRQQADAIVAARRRIVDGAVGMVRMALEDLEEHKTAELDEDRKAAMISNLMVVPCADQPVTPVINAGTLYN